MAEEEDYTLCSPWGGKGKWRGEMCIGESEGGEERGVKKRTKQRSGRELRGEE